MEDLAKNYSLRKWCKYIKHDFIVAVTSPELHKRTLNCLVLFTFIYFVFVIRGCESYSILVEDVKLLPENSYVHSRFEPYVVEIRPGLSRLILERRVDHWEAIFVAGLMSVIVFFASKRETKSIPCELSEKEEVK